MVKIAKKTNRTFINMWGEQVTINFTNIHPMFFAWGLGPPDKKCKDCCFFRREGSKRFYCVFISHHGMATEHRANWPTCKKFIQQEKNGKVVADG